MLLVFPTIRWNIQTLCSFPHSLLIFHLFKAHFCLVLHLNREKINSNHLNFLLNYTAIKDGNLISFRCFLFALEFRAERGRKRRKIMMEGKTTDKALQIYYFCADYRSLMSISAKLNSKQPWNVMNLQWQREIILIIFASTLLAILTASTSNKDEENVRGETRRKARKLSTVMKGD